MIRLVSDQQENMIHLAGGCSLDMHPGTNWVQEAGGLPEY